MQKRAKKSTCPGNARVLVTGAGGPATENAVQSLKLCECEVVGVDVNEDMLRLSGADYKYKVHHASEATEFYIRELNEYYRKHECSMLLPITDREVFVAAVNQYRLPKLPLPHWKLIAHCREKDGLYKFMDAHGFEIPETVYQLEGYKLTKPMWIRASLGAGGYLAAAVYTQEELDGYFQFYKNKHKPFMSEYLQGRNYCWTALYVKGKLELSVSKQRLGWVYNRIGTSAVQRTVHDQKITDLCTGVVNKLVEEFDPEMTGLMMVDLMEDWPRGSLYVTEVNAGRTGTVSIWFSLASRHIFGDDRVNFHYQLLRAHLGLPLIPHEHVDSLPEDIGFTRHIDMGALLSYKEQEWKFSPWGG